MIADDKITVVIEFEPELLADLDEGGRLEHIDEEFERAREELLEWLYEKGLID